MTNPIGGSNQPANPYTDKPAPPKKPAESPKAGIHAPGDCARQHCSVSIGLREVPEADRKRFAEAHGFVSYREQWYCSKRCYVMAQNSPDGTTRAHERGPLPSPAPSDGTKLHTYEVQASDGSTIIWVQCAWSECQGRFECAPGSDMKSRARAAAAHGYVEIASGVYCGATCARKATFELAGQTKRSTPAPQQQSAARSSLSSADDVMESAATVGEFAKSIAFESKRQKRDVTLLFRSLDEVALTEYRGGPKERQRRAVAFKGATIEEACKRAGAALPAFLAGQIGTWERGEK